MDDGIEQRRAIAHACLVAPSPLERYRPDPCRRASHGPVTLAAEGSAGPNFNRVIVLGPAAPDAVVALADGFFGGPAAYSMVVDTEAARALDAGVRTRGWRLDEEEPALVLAPLPGVTPPPPEGLAIRRVLDAAGLADFRGVSETPSIYIPSLAVARDPDVALFVGYVRGRPVATSRVVCLGSTVEISGVVTVPDARRRGYGTALTRAAVAAGRERGCTSAMLTASSSGYPLYVRLGFQPAGIYRTYLAPDTTQV